jgi:hypothetical protein
MNKVYHKRITIDFDMWEPQEKFIQHEVDEIVLAIRTHLQHGAHIHIRSTDEETRPG